MNKTIQILTALLLIYSCSEKNEQTSGTNWSIELIGVGYLGEHPDSLNSLFSFYQCDNNQPEFLKHQFQLQPHISADTIIFPNLLLYDLFRNMEIDNRISKDSSKFLIAMEGELYKFSKISGHNFIPNTVYFKKSPNEYPKYFSYQAVSGFDRWGGFKIEINGKDSIRVRLLGNSYNPCLFELNKKNEVDDLFIASYLNLVCDNRYDTTTYYGVIFSGFMMGETLIYNDSIFAYSTYFTRSPGAGILLNYLRSKLNKDLHVLDKPVQENKKFGFKSFKELPVAVENWEILAPPQEQTNKAP